MPKPLSDSGRKNLISENLIELRHRYNLSQRDLAHELQLIGCDMDKNVITRIETQKRYVTDIEIQKLCEVLHTTFEELTKSLEIRSSNGSSNDMTPARKKSR